VKGPSRDRGMVFQQDTVFPWMRVRDNISYGLRAHGAPAEERERVADKYLSAVGLEQFAESWPKQLSGGMRKRVAVAAAFASDPSILLMDEPFGSLDFVTRLSLHGTLLSLWEQTGKTILFVTHDVDEALVLADRVVMVSEGSIVDDLPVPFPRPRSDELRANPEAIALRRRLLAGLGVSEKPEEGLLA
jgi:NitT/TauT family transport system ATP-binding protein